MQSQAHSEPRVVSLIASATEIVDALGMGSAQVARSHECDYPHSVLSLPQLTRPKFKVEGSSRDIDKAVRTLVEQGLAVYEVDSDGLKAVRPDVILTQDQCEVCAVSLADVEQAVCTWVDQSAEIVSLRPHTMADVYTDIQRVARALGDPQRGDDLVATMQARIDAITETVGDAPRPRLAFIEWTDPPMSGGHWMPELIAAAGGVNLLGRHGETSPWITWEEVAAVDPDVILVGPCGYDLATTLRDLEPLRANPVWQALRAVRACNVFAADGNAYFNRPGPRLVESCEIIAEILHPGRCNFGHLGTAYEQWNAAT